MRPAREILTIDTVAFIRSRPSAAGLKRTSTTPWETAELGVDPSVELFHQGKRVAAHARSRQAGLPTPLGEHRPKSHQKYLEWTKERFLAWAGKTGPHCRKAVGQILEAYPHHEQGYRSCLGLMRLGRRAGAARLEAACLRALHFGTCSYRSIQSILQNGLEAQPLEPEAPRPSPAHDNVRGGPYYA
jgi:transposase